MAARWAVLGLLAAGMASAAKESVLNVCMDAKHHKTQPGPEGALHGQVRSCPADTCQSHPRPLGNCGFSLSPRRLRQA
uniref:Uncharacterized protein n=1 Tax=Chelydra serpentina TaxID=8475 RepID=A0A8C3S4K8_CHESE